MTTCLGAAVYTALYCAAQSVFIVPVTSNSNGFSVLCRNPAFPLLLGIYLFGIIKPCGTPLFLHKYCPFFHVAGPGHHMQHQHINCTKNTIVCHKLHLCDLFSSA
ncbi:hypothetical protein XENTR_v10024718 [Xenopus tropicalis]|nr:hypothetical protein XENTR_v10024718 [Xenopus tropicalis]